MPGLGLGGVQESWLQSLGIFSEGACLFGCALWYLDTLGLLLLLSTCQSGARSLQLPSSWCQFPRWMPSSGGNEKEAGALPIEGGSFGFTLWILLLLQTSSCQLQTYPFIFLILLH